MKKEIPCLDCRGQGFISKFNEKSAWLERCPNCGGTGVITVVVTNADRIRAMSDEELAEFISRIEIGDFGSQIYGKTFCDMCKGQYECDDCRLWWLQQPAEEDT